MTAIDSPLDMELFENAVHNWFCSSTDLETIWANQAKTMPEYPLGVLQIISGPVPTAGHWEVRNATDLSRPAGSEIAQTASLQCSFTVSCQVWVGGDDRSHPAANARFYMMKAQASLGLPSFQSNLIDAEVAVIRSTAIQDISSVEEDAIVSKVNMDVIFGAVLNVTEYNTYIQTMHGTGTFEVTDQGIDREFGDI